MVTSSHFFSPLSVLGGGYRGGYGSALAEVSARYRWQYWHTWKKAVCLKAQGAVISAVKDGAHRRRSRRRCCRSRGRRSAASLSKMIGMEIREIGDSLMVSPTAVSQTLMCKARPWDPTHSVMHTGAVWSAGRHIEN